MLLLIIYFFSGHGFMLFVPQALLNKIIKVLWITSKFIREYS